MDDWVTNGVASPYEATQTKAAIGLLQDAATATRESRIELNRLDQSLSILLRHTLGRLRHAGYVQTHAPAPQLLAEVRTLATEAEAVMATVTKHLSEATNSLLKASAVSHHSEARQQGGETTGSRAGRQGSPRPARVETMDEITSRDDLRHSN